MWGSCERISPEAPVQVVNVAKESQVLGGAGNVINNLKELGARVDVISVIGNCETSNELKELLAEIGVDTKYLITQKNRTTSKKSRIMASQQQVVRYDSESTDDIDAKSQTQIINIFKKIIKWIESKVCIFFIEKSSSTFKSSICCCLWSIYIFFHTNK